MPKYSWMASKNIDFLILRKKLSVMKNLGVPYTEDEIANADINAEKEAKKIADNLVSQGGPAGLERKEIVAVIAYLQALGQMKKKEVTK